MTSLNISNVSAISVKTNCNSVEVAGAYILTENDECGNSFSDDLRNDNDEVVASHGSSNEGNFIFNPDEVGVNLFKSNKKYKKVTLENFDPLSDDDNNIGSSMLHSSSMDENDVLKEMAVFGNPTIHKFDDLIIITCVIVVVGNRTSVEAHCKLSYDLTATLQPTNQEFSKMKFSL